MHPSLKIRGDLLFNNVPCRVFLASNGHICSFFSIWMKLQTHWLAEQMITALLIKPIDHLPVCFWSHLMPGGWKSVAAPRFLCFPAFLFQEGLFEEAYLALLMHVSCNCSHKWWRGVLIWCHHHVVRMHRTRGPSLFYELVNKHCCLVEATTVQTLDVWRNIFLFCSRIFPLYSSISRDWKHFSSLILNFSLIKLFGNNKLNKSLALKPNVPSFKKMPSICRNYTDVLSTSMKCSWADLSALK